MTSSGLAAVALRAVDEVGNPTILATLAVVAAILPMAFVGGLMGPYMRPIPVGASAAMAFSLIVAFVVTPWAAIRLLKTPKSHDHDHEDAFTRLYRRVMRPLLASPRVRWLFLSGVAVLLLGAMALVPLGLVTVKMLPFDNKSEFQVMVDMPEGTPLETTARVAGELATAALRGRGRDQRAVVCRHVGAVQLQRPGAALLPAARASPGRPPGQPRAEGRAQCAEPRDRAAHARSAGADRDALGATMQVAEVPPGPPVLQTLVAEVYGPDPARRQAIAAQINRSSSRPRRRRHGLVRRTRQRRRSRWRSTRRRRRRPAFGRRRGVARADGAGGCRSAGCCTTAPAREDVPLVLRLPRADAHDRRDAVAAGGRRALDRRRRTDAADHGAEQRSSITRTCSR